MSEGCCRCRCRCPLLEVTDHYSCCFRVDMKHRFRRDLVRGDAESSMSQQRLQHRMREQSVNTHTNTHTLPHTHSPLGITLCQVCQVNGRNAIMGGACAAEEEEEER